MPLGVEQPTVIAAADAARLDLGVVERGAATAAARMCQARLIGPIAKQDEVFAERAPLPRPVRRVRRQAGRMPIAAQQFAHWGAAADLDELGFVACWPHLVGRPLVARQSLHHVDRSPLSLPLERGCAI